MGGLSKKASQFTRHIKESKRPFLILDGGSLLFKSKSLTKKLENQARITAKGIVKTYNLIGYDAVGVSSQDLAAGLNFLLQTKKNSKFDWLSANIINKSNGKPLFKPTISRTIGNIKIGVVGLTNPLPANSKLLNKDTEIKPWRDTMPAIINGLSKDHDFIVLLTSLPAKECREIAKIYPAINLIIRAKNSDASQLPTNLTETTAMVSTGKKGKYIGMMNVKWYPGSTWQAPNHELLAGKKEERDRLNRQLALQKNRSAQNYYYQKIQSRLKVIDKTIELMEQEGEPATKNATPKSSYQNRFMAMEISLPDHAAVLEIVEETKRLVNKLNSEATRTVQNNKLINKGFTGWRTCRKCHSDQVKNWQKTRHASSFLTLIKKNQQFNPDCLSCHVTGVDTNDPSAAIGMPSDLQIVGCETCHGPGTLHSMNPVSHKTTPVTEKICMNCHVPNHDESFDFASDIKKLKCKF
ncbi:MAG: UshA-like (seleno)protein [Thermodesulfobacteriota bacterium]